MPDMSYIQYAVSCSCQYCKSLQTIAQIVTWIKLLTSLMSGKKHNRSTACYTVLPVCLSKAPEYCVVFPVNLCVC